MVTNMFLPLQFAARLDTYEDLQLRAEPDGMTDVTCTRRGILANASANLSIYATPSAAAVFFVTISELLKNSLQVLTSSSILFQSLRRLQRTEALQRSGGVLQEEGACEEVQVLVLSGFA